MDETLARWRSEKAAAYLASALAAAEPDPAAQHLRKIFETLASRP